MRNPIWIALAALAACAAGCLPVPSLYPLVEPEQGIEVPEVVGEWGDSTSSIVFRHERGTRYSMSASDSGEVALRFRVLFARFGGRLFADFAAETESYPGGDPEPWLWSMHTIFRVDVAGDSLRLAFLDDDWTKRALDRHTVKLRHERPRDAIVLTERTPGLQALARRLANVDAAFDSSAKFIRRR